MIAGYATRMAHQQDLVAWQTVLLMRSTGNYSRETMPTERDVLGRDRFPLDPRWRPEPSFDAVEAAWRRDLHEAEAQAAAGHGVIGRLTEEELAQAYAEASIS